MSTGIPLQSAQASSLTTITFVNWYNKNTRMKLQQDGKRMTEVPV